MGKRNKQHQVEIVALTIESNLDGYVELNISFGKLCREYYLPDFMIHHYATHKAFFNHWKYILVGQKSCQRDTYLKDFQMSMNTSNFSRALTLKAVWIPNVFHKFKLYLRQNTENCNLNTTYMPLQLACSNLSQYNLKGPRYFLSLKVIPSPIKTKLQIKDIDNESHWYINLKYQCLPESKSSLISWEKGSFICNNIGGSLPFFTSRSEFMAFLALLSLYDQLTPVEAVFIGLRIQSSPQVGFQSCINLYFEKIFTCKGIGLSISSHCQSSVDLFW